MLLKMLAVIFDTNIYYIGAVIFDTIITYIAIACDK